MLYGSAVRGTSSPRPGQIDKGHIVKREANGLAVRNETADYTTRPPLILTASTQRSHVKKKQLPELDVVGLIRVLDRPENDDAANYREQEENGNNHRQILTAGNNTQSLILSNYTRPVPITNTTSGGESFAPQAEKQVLTAAQTSGREEEGVDGSKCLPKSIYYILVSSLALLSIIQLSGTSFFLIDRFLLGRAASKRIYHFMRYH